MNYNHKLFDLLDSNLLPLIKAKTEVRNSRIKDLTVDELRELWPFISDRFPSLRDVLNLDAYIPDAAKSIIILTKMA